MSPKPAYETLLKLVKKEWWTGPLALTADAAGRATFRGYLGEYRIEGGTAAGTFAISAAGKQEVSVKLGRGAFVP
jgi:hypothetical protein